MEPAKGAAWADAWGPTGSQGAALTPRPALPFPMLLDDREHGFAVGRLFQGLAKIGAVEEFGDVGERVEVFLELALRHEEEHDEIDRLIVQGVKVHAFLGSAERADDFVNQVRRGVRDADAESDAGAHRRLALLDDGGDRIVMLGFDLAGHHEVADQLVNGLPAISRLQIREDLVFRQNVA